MAMKRIAHAAYNVSDIDAAIHYYCDLLGMEKLFTLPLGDGRTLLYLRFAPAQFLELFYGASADQTPHGNTGSFEHLCIEVDNIADMYDDYVKRGVPGCCRSIRGLGRQHSDVARRSIRQSDRTYAVRRASSAISGKLIESFCP